MHIKKISSLTKIKERHEERLEELLKEQKKTRKDK